MLKINQELIKKAMKISIQADKFLKNQIKRYKTNR